jgi:hypothetical protein
MVLGLVAGSMACSDGGGADAPPSPRRHPRQDHPGRALGPPRADDAGPALRAAGGRDAPRRSGPRPPVVGEVVGGRGGTVVCRRGWSPPCSRPPPAPCPLPPPPAPCPRPLPPAPAPCPRPCPRSRARGVLRSESAFLWRVCEGAGAAPRLRLAACGPGGQRSSRRTVPRSPRSFPLAVLKQNRARTFSPFHCANLSLSPSLCFGPAPFTAPT